MALCWRQPSTAIGSSTSVTLAAPAGLSDGDLILVWCFALQAMPVGFTAPDSGWIKWQDLSVATGGNVLMLSVFSQIASGETPTWKFSAASTASFAGAVCIFDDGGAAVDLDLVTAASQPSNVSSYAAPPITPNGSADPMQLVIGAWGTPSAIALPQIGSPLFTGAASTGHISAGAYAVQRGSPASPTATATSGPWLAAQVAAKTIGVSPQRRMMRSCSNKISSTIPVPSDIVNGDLLLAFAQSTSSGLGTPAGWSVAVGSVDNLYKIYYRTAASEPSTYSFTNAEAVSLVSFLDMDGAAMAVDTISPLTAQGNGILYVTPSISVQRNSSIVVSNFMTVVGTLFGPYGPQDGGGSHLDYATQVDANTLVSYTLQPTQALSARKTAYSGATGAWYAGQIAIQGIDEPIMVGTDLFPELPGLSWSLMRQPEAGLTVVQKSQSGKEARWALRAPGRPIWTLTLAYEVLRANRGLSTPMTGRYLNIAQVADSSTLFNADTLTENEYAVLVGFFNRQGGSARAWLFDDANDNTAGLYLFGRGDGNRTVWNTAFNAAWQAQFPQAPQLFTDRSPTGQRVVSSFGLLNGATLDSNGTITISPTPNFGTLLYITAPSASYLGHPLLGEQFGVGDGVSTSFQLVRWLGGMAGGIAEPIQNLNGLPTIWVDGIQQTPIVSTSGVCTFASAPVRGSVLSWSGKFYVRARFNSDSESFEEFAYNLFSLGKLDLISVLT